MCMSIRMEFFLAFHRPEYNFAAVASRRTWHMKSQEKDLSMWPRDRDQPPAVRIDLCWLPSVRPRSNATWSAT